MILIASDPYAHLPNFSGIDAKTIDETRVGDPARFFPSIRRGVVDAVTGRILNTPRVCVFRAAAFNITTGPAVIIPWDAKEYDTDGMWNVNLAPTHITCVTPGLYEFHALGQFADSAAGWRQWYLRKNGSKSYANTVIDSNAGGVGNSQQIGWAIPLNVGDYVEFLMAQNSGITLALTAASTLDLLNGLSAELVSTFGSDN